MSATEVLAREALADVISEGSVQYFTTVPTVDQPGPFVLIDFDSSQNPTEWIIPVRLHVPLANVTDALNLAMELSDEYEALLRDAGYLTTSSRVINVDIGVAIETFQVTCYRSDF